MNDTGKRAPSIAELRQHLGTITQGYRRQRDQLQRLSSFVALQQQLLETVTADIDRATLLERMETALAVLSEIIGADGASLLVPDRGTGELVFLCVHGEQSPDLKGTRLELHSGLAGWVARSGRPAVVNNASMDDRFFDGIDALTGFDTHSLIAVPVAHAGRILGVLELVNEEEGGLFTKHQVGQVHLCAHFFALLLERIASDSGDNGNRRDRLTGT